MAFSLVAAIVCLFLMAFGKGYASLVAVTLIGFFVSIFYPTLYAIATDGLGTLTGRASGLLTLGFLGCAVIPVFQGTVADSVGIPYSYLTAILVYSFVLFYVLSGQHMKPKTPLGTN